MSRDGTMKTKRQRKRKVAPHEILTSAVCQGIVGTASWGRYYAGELDMAALAHALKERAEQVNAGDLSHIEAMLLMQAKTLETIFTGLARRAADLFRPDQLQVNLSLALRAQAQCRATLETLAEIKNPRPVAFVQQANVAQQQVVQNAALCAAGAAIPANELLRASHGERLDFETTGATSHRDPVVATLGKIDGSADDDRKGSKRT